MRRKTEIIEKLGILLSEPLLYIGRASELLWIGFGEKIEITNSESNIRTVGAYALHVQCPWRVIRGNKIYIASGDLYQPKEGLSWDDFDWEEYGSNQFDVKASKINEVTSQKKLVVTKISADSLGGMSITFSGNYTFQIFPHISQESEYWRLINFKNGEHFVVFEE